MTQTRSEPADGRECRVLALPVAELRVEKGSDGKLVIRGYAAVYNRLSENLGGFREQIAPGFFDKVLATCDCRALVNHDSNIILGRSTKGTLRLISDATGLGMEIDPPETDIAAHYVENIRRGDIDGCSFSFIASVDQWDYSGEIPIRTLVECKALYDVGPVTFPAYPDTSVALRSLEANRPHVVPSPSRPGALSRMRMRQRLAEARSK